MAPNSALVYSIRMGAVALAAVTVLAACGANRDQAATQTAAKVDKQEITVHQINFVLQQQRNLRPEQADAAGRQILERLIDQELLFRKAQDLKIDRDPRVVQQLEAGKREIIARAYVERVGESAPKPTPEEIRKYYQDKPALFAERRIFNLQEIAIDAKPEQGALLREKLAAGKNMQEFIDFLRANDFRFTGNQAVRAAEQLPLASLDTFARLQDGQALINATPSGFQVIVLAGSRRQPVTEEQARPAIEQFILNERKRKLVEDDIKQLRANAKIEYVGKFAGGPAAMGAVPAAADAAAAASAAPAAGSTPAPAASSALGAGEVTRGLSTK